MAWTAATREQRLSKGDNHIFTKGDVCHIMGLIWPKVGPTWCTPFTGQACWRAIGVGQNGFDFNLIDTEKLLDDATAGSNPAAASAAAAVASDNSSPETRSMVVASEQVAENVLPDLPVPSPPAKVRRTSAAYWQQKTTSAVEQRDEARLKVAQMEAAVLSAKGLGLYDDPDKGWQKPTASRKVLAGKEGGLYTTALLARKRAREEADITGTTAAA